MATTLWSLSASADNSMRKCMLLPIHDSVGGATGFQVFQDIEGFLRESEWCYYRPNSEIINILGSYKNKLNDHLKNPDVLRVISEKTQAGSLIKVDISHMLKGTEVTLAIYGSNGVDVFFKDTYKLDTTDITLISQAIRNGLEAYSKRIPYDGKVIGVLGDQFTMDLGKNYGVVGGAQVSVLRPLQKRRHPLLKEIVEWDSEKLANATVFHVTESQSQAKVNNYESNKKIEAGDWVIVGNREGARPLIDQTPFESKMNDFSFGKLGQLSLAATYGGLSSTITSGSTTKKISGTGIGVDLIAELWATRNWWGSFELSKKFGTLERDEGSFSQSEYDIDTTRIKIKAGYKYLPLGFFYGPQVDLFIGYARYNYSFDTVLADSIVETSFTGILLGAKGSMPVIKDVRIHLLLDFVFNPGYEEEVTVRGEADGTSNFNLEFGGTYQWSPSMAIYGAFEFVTNKANFPGTSSEMKMSESGLKVGTTFMF